MKMSFKSEAARMLLRDHKRISDLLFHFQQSEDLNHKLSFAETALNELAVHFVLEEECVYPLLENASPDHEKMDELMAKLGQLERVDENYIELFSQLSDMISEHVEEEERDLLPSLEKIATDELAQQMSDLKNELLKYESGGDKDFSPQILLIDRLHSRRKSA